MATTEPGESHSNLTAVIEWCDRAIALLDGGDVVVMAAQAKRIYDGFDGALAGIGGEVGQAAEGVAEAGFEAQAYLSSLWAALTHLRDRAAAAIGD